MLRRRNNNGNTNGNTNGDTPTTTRPKNTPLPGRHLTKRSKQPLPADELPPPPVKHTCKQDVKCMFRDKSNYPCPAKGCQSCMMIALKKITPANCTKWDVRLTTRTVCRSCKVRVNWCVRSGLIGTFDCSRHVNTLYLCSRKLSMTHKLFMTPIHS